MKKTGLALRTLTQGVRSKINLLSLVIDPEDLIAVILKPEIVETSRIDTEEFEHLTLCKQRPQVNHAGKPVLPNDFDDAEYDRLRTMHGDNFSHGTLSPSPLEAITDRPTHQGWRW